MKNIIENGLFEDEEVFQKVYSECMKNSPSAPTVVMENFKKLDSAFDRYLNSVQENAFRYAYQCGYEAAMAEIKKGGAV